MYLLESVQHRATRMINGLRKMPYEERMKLMDLPPYLLSYRRLRGDAIQTYNLVHGNYSINWATLLICYHWQITFPLWLQGVTLSN